MTINKKLNKLNSPHQIDIYKLMTPLVGLRVNDAVTIANSKGFVVRIVSFNKKEIQKDSSFVWNRVNLSIESGSIVSKYEFY